MYKIIFALCVLGGASVVAQRVAPGVAPQHYQQPPQQHPQHPPPPQQYQQVPQHQQQQQQQPQHNVPPGVNPQQYQPQQVQYQQVPLHQQQIPVPQVPVVQQQQHQQVPLQQQQQQQHQQVPLQQQHQQVPVQQVPQGHGGGHHAPHATHGQVLNAANIANEKDHIQEHLHVPIDTSKMSEAELQFHYFKMHDSDNNNKLDGCELIKSLIHWHANDHNEKKENETLNEHGDTGEKEVKSYTDENLADVADYVLKSMDLNNDGYVDYTEYRKSEQESAKENNQ